MTGQMNEWKNWLANKRTITKWGSTQRNQWPEPKTNEPRLNEPVNQGNKTIKRIFDLSGHSLISTRADKTEGGDRKKNKHGMKTISKQAY